MSQDDRQARVRAFYEQAVNQGDRTAVDGLVASTEVAHHAGAAVGQNTSVSVKKWVVDIRAAFPDTHAIVEEWIADGDKLVNPVTYRGTHLGEYNDPVWRHIAPTGKQIARMAIAINRFEGGKSVEACDLMDESGIWQHLGIIPAPNQA